MDVLMFQHNLTALNPVEAVGKHHFAKYGRNLDYLQFLYLQNYPLSDDLDTLYSDAAIAEQQRIRENLQDANFHNILNPQKFFAEGRNLEIEKLLRYVDIPAHQHDFIEFAFVFCGKCLHHINGQDYLQESGSFAAIPYGCTHALFPEEDCLCLTVKIRGDTFQKLDCPGLINFIYPLVYPCGEDDFVRYCLCSMWEQQEKQLPYAEKIEEQLFQIMMLYIAQQFRDDVVYLISGNRQGKQIIEILSYMIDNYRTVTLKSVAEHFHYHSAYFSRMIRVQTGKTFSELVKDYKLRQAARLLLETNRKLNDICDEVGYKDTTQFIRSFKALFGITPIQYRKRGVTQ